MDNPILNIPAKKDEYNYGNNLSRIYSDPPPRKLRTNQSRELLVNNQISN